MRPLFQYRLLITHQNVNLQRLQAYLKSQSTQQQQIYDRTNNLPTNRKIGSTFTSTTEKKRQLCYE